MMERKYQLVAWTENIAHSEKARLYMIPSLECEVQAELIADLADVHKEEYKYAGSVSLDLSRRTIRAYENMSRFEILTAHYGDGIRYLFFAAKYCICEEDGNGVRRELRGEFVRLCEEGIRLAKKYRREDILQEMTPTRVLKSGRESLRLFEKISGESGKWE